MTHKFLTTLYHISVHKNTTYYCIHATLLYFYSFNHCSLICIFLPAYFSRQKSQYSVFIAFTE
nr:MAG TPA: hypothetical protein [Caudoviricetes sp.]